MRIAISDYDGTLRQDGVVSGATLAAIWKWREAGNRFGIATGRDLVMIAGELKKWAIPVDFLVCANGAAIYDHNLNLIQGKTLDDAVVPKIMNHPAAVASMHYQITDTGDKTVHLFLRGGESWFPKLGVPYTEVTFDEAEKMRNLRQIALAYLGKEECAEWARVLNADLAGVAFAHQNVNCIDITPHNVSKATGINELMALRGWRDEEVLVIGDGDNDLEMIARFDGYAVSSASVRIQKLARGIFRDVADMLTSPCVPYGCKRK